MDVNLGDASLSSIRPLSHPLPPAHWALSAKSPYPHRSPAGPVSPCVPPEYLAWSVGGEAPEASLGTLPHPSPSLSGLSMEVTVQGHVPSWGS